MVTEMVVKESLSSEMISAGAQLTRRLDQMHFVVSASFWFYLSDINSWRLIIATPEVKVNGPKKAYKQIQSAIARMPENLPKIALKDISVVDSQNPLILRLRVFGRVEGISGVRFSNNVINGVPIEDAYIYRLT